MSTTILETLLELSHFLGEEKRQLAILGEGNTSARVDVSRQSKWKLSSDSCER